MLHLAMSNRNDDSYVAPAAAAGGFNHDDDSYAALAAAAGGFNRDDDSYVAPAAAAGGFPYPDLEAKNFALALLGEYPLKKIERKKGRNTQQINDLFEQDHAKKVQEFVGGLCSLPYCFGRNNSRFSCCNCLKYIEEAQVASISTMLGIYSCVLCMSSPLIPELIIILFFVYSFLCFAA